MIDEAIPERVGIKRPVVHVWGPFGMQLECKLAHFWRKITALQFVVSPSVRGSGWSRNRTGDTRFFRPLLYQLSYPALPADSENVRATGRETPDFGDRDPSARHVH